MKTIIAAIVALVTSLIPSKDTTGAKDKVTALVAQLDAEADTAYANAEALNALAVSVMQKATAERVFAADTKGLAGRLEAAVN